MPKFRYSKLVRDKIVGHQIASRAKKSQAQLSDRLAKAAQHVTVDGRYMHYKQLSYKVLALALREEDSEPCVVYQAEYGEQIVWVRPVSSWLEAVKTNGQKVRRFEKITTESSLRASFNTVADRYHALRPTYPPALFDQLVADTHLPQHAELLEIGPGTGQATKPLAERGYAITAIELGKDLAAKAQQVLADFPHVQVITSAFEDVELPPEHYDLVYSATAFHWIKPEFKFTKPHKLLKPDGHLAIIHTEHVSDEAGDKFFFASQPIYQTYHAKSQAPDKLTATPPPHLKDVRPPEKIDEALFSLKSFTAFPVALTYTSQEYSDLLATYSPHLALPEDERAAFLAKIKALIDKDFGGHITKHYAMTLTLAKKR